MKPYIFDGKEIRTLNELGEAYTNNFAEAIEDVCRRTKRMLKFIRKVGGTKLACSIASEIISCKYENNAVTFIIFKLCDDKRVVINGNIISFKDFIKLIKTFGEDEKACFAFVEDYGLTKTYGTLDVDKKLIEDSYYIEKSIKDPFTIKYLKEYYSYGYNESLKTKLSNVFIYNEEQYRRTSKIISSEEFQLQLAHMTSFKKVYLMRQEHNPLFQALKILKEDKLDEFDDRDLIGVVTEGTYFWWLLENFEGYEYKGKAKEIYKELSTEKKVYATDWKEYDFSEKIEMSRRLNEIYLMFVQLYKEGLITVKKKSDMQDLAMDKPYCRTLISSGFMKKNPVKLSKVVTIVNENGEEVHQNEDGETEIVIELERNLDEKKLKKQERLYKSHKKFSVFSGIFSALALLVMTGEVFYEKFVADAVKGTANVLTYAFGAGSVVLLMALAIILRIKADKGQSYVKQCYYIEGIIVDDKAKNVDEEKLFEKYAENKKAIRKNASRSHRFTAMLTSAFLGAAAATLAIFALGILASFNVLTQEWTDKFINGKQYYFIVAGPAFGLLWGLLFKKKGVISAILISLVAAGGVIALLFISL